MGVGLPHILLSLYRGNNIYSLWLEWIVIWVQLRKGILGYPAMLCKYRRELVLCRVRPPMLIAVLEAK